MLSKPRFSLEPKEIECLTLLRLMEQASQERVGSIPVRSVLDSEQCISYLDRLTGIFQSPSRAVAASQFSKRYAFLTLVPALYTMTMFNKGLNLSIDNSYVESVFRDQIWLPHLRLADLTVSSPANHRHEWREEMLSVLFAGNLAPIWRSMSAAANISMSILWENTAVYVYWLYEKRLTEETKSQNISRIQDDFHYLIHEAPGYLFGEAANPLQKYYSPLNTSCRIRKTCCLYYQISAAADYCSGCPKKC
jgi:ferric iron reductase protein FhuF